MYGLVHWRRYRDNVAAATDAVRVSDKRIGDDESRGSAAGH